MPNWNLYRDQFPTRYWEIGSFDEKLIHRLNSYVLNYNPKNCLDIGCGALGTLVLKEFSQNHNISVDMLDPFINLKPNWMNKQISWNNIPKNYYDILVLRGSINYLSIEQLISCKNSLKYNGILIANTFLKEPSENWRERKVKNLKGEEGIEKSRLFNGKVQHQIIFDDYFVEHEFYYYSKEKYMKIFDQIKFEEYGNSTLIEIKKT